MSTNLYDQAIADAKKLKELAEQNATNKIIESIAPKIRMLIEQEIDQDIDMSDGEDDSIEEDMEDLDAMLNTPTSVDIDSSVSSFRPIDVEEEINLEDEDEESEKNVTVNITVESRLDRRAKLLRKKAVGLVIKLKEAKSNKQKNILLRELSKIKKNLVLTNESDKKLNIEINEVLKESKKMNKNKKSWINENSWWLFEAEEGDEDLDLELGDEEAEDEDGDEGIDIDVDAIKSAVEELAGAIGLEVAAEEGADDEEEDEDEDEDLDLDLEEIDEMYNEMDMKKDELDEMDKMEMDEEDEDLDETIEISESAIRRELLKLNRSSRRRQTSRRDSRISESRRRRMSRRRRIAEMGDPMSAQSNFGGSDQVIEVSEEALINALAEELGNSDGVDLNIDGSGDASKMASSFGGGSASRQEAVQESRRRRQSKRLELKRRKELIEAKKVAHATKKELNESNLFNAKLLYVNKLMQQHDLNAKQQRAIVEALDNAKTQREAKLLYTSLTESLRRRGQSKTSTSNLNEGLVRGGSVSTPARSSAPAKSSKGLNRWATLAGIKK